MSLYLLHLLGDGSSVVKDSDDGAEFALRPGQWEILQRKPHDEQRRVVEQFVLANRSDYTRTEQDEQAMQTARDAASGEAHQDESE